MRIYEQAELYAAAFSWPVDKEVDWLLQQVPGVRRVLEPMCGNARYAAAFTRHGIAYHGFDVAETMLALARPGPGIELRRADARDFSLGGLRFELVFWPVNSFAYLLEEQDIVRSLECVRKHLTPDGVLVVELELVDHDGPWPHGVADRSRWEIEAPDGSLVRAEVARTSCDRAARRCIERASYQRLKDGRVLEELSESHTLRMWTAADIAGLPARAGLALARCHRHAPARPIVELSPALENSGDNVYFFFRPEALSAHLGTTAARPPRT